MQRTFRVLTLLCVFAYACSSPNNNTKIFVVVSSDLAVPVEIDSIVVDVHGPAGTVSITRPLLATGQTGQTSLPIVVALVPPDNKDLAFEVTATAFLSGASLVAQTARLSFASGQSRVLSLVLERLCTGKSCDGNTTCSAGRCDHPVDVDTGNLPIYDPATLFLPADGGPSAVPDGGLAGDVGSTADIVDRAVDLKLAQGDAKTVAPGLDGAVCPTDHLDDGTGTCVPVAGVTWSQTGTVQDWSSVASSADGTKWLAAVWGGPLYNSVDSGKTWSPLGTSRNWISVASSADGVKLVALVSAGNIHLSTDSGVTWSQKANANTWHAVASSADGKKLVALVRGGTIYMSADSGGSWSPHASALPWSAVASSADGTKLVAVELGGYIHTSVDSGTKWTKQGESRNWISVASSADGRKLVALDSGPGYIYTSTDAGATWVQREALRAWRSVASSSDGSKLVAVDNGPGYIYTSTDSGATWAKRGTSQNWKCVASSADGTTLVALASGGFIYTSNGPVP